MKSFLGIDCRGLLAASSLLVLSSPLGCGSQGAQTSGTGGSTVVPSSTGGSSPSTTGQGGVAGGSGGSAASGTGGQATPASTGGNLPTGGASASGGVITSGGVTASGGALSPGGVATGGGVSTSGGVSVTGGVSPSGGVKATGGGLASGGMTATGGASAAGGAPATGGVKSSGGVTSAGGTSAGGSTAASGTPVLVSTINLKTSGGCPGLRLGDLNGDGKMEIVVAQPTDQTALGDYGPQFAVCVTAYDLKGNQLWQYGKPGPTHTASSDIPVQIYDMDGDGKSEVFVNMNTTTMTVLDGTTGTVMRTIPLPQAGANDSIAFANLRGKAWPQDIIVKTRYSQEWAIVGIDDATTTPTTKAGTLLWNHKMLASDSKGSDLGTGHYPLVYDWDGDGKDEVMCGYDFLDSDGTKLWTLNTTSNPKLTMHADSIATGDMDGNPANGYEIVVNGNVAAAFNWKTGAQLWQDTNTIEAQQLGMGDYRPDLPGLEVVLLDRLRTAAEGFKSNNVLVDQHDKLLWKENRPTNSGWLTVTENMNNWDGNKTDMILSYRRDGKSDGSGGTGTYLYDGNGKTVASFPYTGSSAQSFAQHADLCGDGKEEVIEYDETTIWIYANGGCNLDDPPAKPSLPQQFHLYNWSIYTGWINPDPKFYTPGSKQ